MTGFLYFALYKQFKHTFHDYMGDKYDTTYIFLLASFTAELLTLGVQYPYDLIKCRLQSVNDKFQYKNLRHAFETEARNNGFFSLYRGVFPFLTTYCAFVTLQFTVYEKMIEHYKHKLGHDNFVKNEFWINCYAGFAAGSIAAAFTNCLEAITVAKQTNPELNIFNMVKKEGP